METRVFSIYISAALLLMSLALVSIKPDQSSTWESSSNDTVAMIWALPVLKKNKRKGKRAHTTPWGSIIDSKRVPSPSDGVWPTHFEPTWLKPWF